MMYFDIAFFAIFATIAGYFLGTGNYGGFLGTLFPGVLAGAVLAIHHIRSHEWRTVGIIIAAALLGSVISWLTPATNGIKQYCRNQSNLVLHIGSYKLGKLSNQSD